MNENDILQRNTRAGFLLLLCVFFAFGLFDHSFWSSNDCREGAMIWDMYQSGTWVTPTLNGVPYLEKPPLLHWTGLVFCYLAGSVNEGLVRLPAALYGLGAICVAWLFGRKLGRERAGMTGAFMCATSVIYLEYSKIVLTDMALAFMVALSLYLFWQAYTAKTASAARYAVFIVVSAFAFYAKGLLGPGFIWVSVGCFLLFKRRWKLLTALSLLFAIVFVAVLAPWVWFLWKTGGRDFIRIIFWDNQFGRFLHFSNPDLPKDPFLVHKEPFYYYLTSLPGRLMPWSLLVALALFSWFKKGSEYRNDLAVFLKITLVSMALILHVSSAKVACYALPLFPILFLMTAIWIEDNASAIGSRITLWAIRLTTGIVILVAVVVPVAYIIMFFLPQSFYGHFFHSVNLLKTPGLGIAAVGLLGAILMLVVGAYAMKDMRRKISDGLRAEAMLSLPIYFAIVVILGGTIFAPAYDFQRSYRPFAQLVKREMANGRRIALASDEEKHIGSFTFYLNSRLPIACKPPDVRTFLILQHRPAGIIMKADDMTSQLIGVERSKIRILKVSHTGYKSAEFRLVVSD
jgi:4-amino-4-deoxy-L-arabinose transferase-like glycosyltransferase